ncbi:TonB-dependent receptor, partial [hydrothermal vent metagenome]
MFVRPATLRNLSPDQTLVMVNGKRRHRSALLAGRTGAQAPDMAVIPSYGISRVEVLRDGAAAQYGSDAIAGVVNVILDTDPGFSVYGQYGQYYQGDGEQFRIGGKAGFELGDDGYIVVTAEYNNTGRTVRSRQRPDAAAFQLANPNIDVRNPAQQWGQPERKSVRIMVNSKIAVDENMNFYAFGTFAGGKGSSDFNWRNPDTSSAFKLSPTVFPNFNLRTIFPGGFTPQFGQDDRDYSAVVGLEGYITPNFTYDASIGYGKNQIVYFMSDTFNPSLGPDSPTTFKPGTLEQEEVNFNLDFVYTLATDAFADDISIAFGAERRNETYSVILGDLASRQIGPGAADGLPATSNGFSGFNDSQVGDFSQNNIGLYLDVEVPVTDKWTVGGAIRFEDYSIFGNTLDVKFSSRYEINDNFAVRATASTGFRAPTPAQLFSERIDQTFDPFNPAQLDTNGRFSSEGAIADLISQRDGVTISSLDAEESNNYTLGFVYNADNGFNVTIDLYQIDIDKRLGTTTNFALTDAERN